jgi:hypothetical protein
VLGGGGVPAQACAAELGSTPLHRVRLDWQLPTLGSDHVTSYSVYRVIGDEANTTNLLDRVFVGAVTAPTRTLVDLHELHHGTDYAYVVVAAFDNATVSGYSVSTDFTTITAVNDAPVANDQNVPAINEDTPASPTITLIATDVDSASLTYSIAVPPSHGTLSGALPNVTYTPHLNYFGPDSFTFKANDTNTLPPNGYNDPGRDSNEATVWIMVSPVNDAPGFTKGANQTVKRNSGAQSVSGWATSISAGPANSTPPADPPASESGQIVNFIVANDNNALFSVQPAISSTGTLTYTPEGGNKTGTATVTVRIHDDGGIDNGNGGGGVDTSGLQTFTITVVK